jgi:hypothetical protein
MPRRDAILLPEMRIVILLDKIEIIERVRVGKLIDGAPA